MENTGETSNYQRIWESIVLPKDYLLGKQYSSAPTIFFIITGSVCFKTNGMEEHTIFAHEMFITRIDNSYEIIMIEPTHLIICCVPMEAWFKEQKWIEGLISTGDEAPESFFKLPIRRMVVRYLSLLEQYIKEGFFSSDFFELKRQELFFLFTFYYSKGELARFLQSVFYSDIQFKNLVVSNCIHAKNVRELAKFANYSTSGFIKKFRKCFNESPYRWMQKQKAKQISIEIYKGNKSLQEIANEYNFSSYQHFSFFCKTQLGAPPTVILGRNKMKNG